MTRDDFNAWLDHHYAVFPGFNKWLLSMPPADRSATLRAWSNILEPIPLAIAKQASETLYAADAIPVYERHVAAVKRLADGILTRHQRQQTTARFGCETYRCLACHDTGLVPIYVRGNRLRHVIANVGAEQAAKTVSLAVCDCEAGASKNIGDTRVASFRRGEDIVAIGGWSHLRATRHEEYAKRMAEVSQAEYEVRTGTTVDHDFQCIPPVTSETEF